MTITYFGFHECFQYLIKVEALNDGLVGHWELGDIAVPACSGGNAIDHGGDDWILKDTEIIGGQ